MGQRWKRLQDPVQERKVACTRLEHDLRWRRNMTSQKFKNGWQGVGEDPLDATGIAGRFVGSRGGRYGGKRVYSRGIPVFEIEKN